MVKNLNKYKWYYLMIMMVSIVLAIIYAPEARAAMYAYSDNIIPVMTSNTTPTGIVTASENSSNAYLAFDKSQSSWSTGWDSWITYEFPTPHLAKKASVDWALNANFGTYSVNYDLYGYNEENSQWDHLAFGEQAVEFNNTKSYKKFKFHLRVDEINEGIFSSLEVKEISLYEETTIPNPPQGLQAVPGDNKVDLTWQASPGATQYTVKRTTSPSGTYQVIANSLSVCNFTDNTAINGNTYYYVVSANNTSGESVNSNRVSVYVKEIIPPVTTVTLEGTKGANDYYNSEVQVYLSATDNPGGSGVTKTEYSFDGNNWTTYTESFTVGAEGINRIYYRSTDKDGNTEDVKWMDIKIDTNIPLQDLGSTGTDNIIPVMTSNITPTGIASASYNSNNAYLAFDKSQSSWSTGWDSWISYQFPSEHIVKKASVDWALNANFGIYGVSYDLYGYNEENSQWDYLAFGDQTVEFNNTKSYKKFKFHLRVDEINEGVFYSLDVKEISLYEIPNPPQNLHAVPGNTKVDLSWDPVSDATQYIVKRATTSGGPYEVLASNITTTSYTDENLVNGTKYYYVVSALTARGESLNSNEVNAAPYSITYGTSYTQSFDYSEPKIITKIDFSLNKIDDTYYLPTTCNFEGYNEATNQWDTLSSINSLIFGNNELAINSNTAYKKYRLNLLFDNSTSVSLNVTAIQAY